MTFYIMVLTGSSITLFVKILSGEIMEVSKQDWKLFQEKIGKWQEAYMEKLIKKYVAFLNVNKFLIIDSCCS